MTFYREKAGLKIYHLYVKTGLGDSYLRRLEKGLENISVDSLIKISAALAQPLNKFVTIKEFNIIIEHLRDAIQ